MRFLLLMGVFSLGMIYRPLLESSILGEPSGAIMILASGTCPANWREATALNGKFLQGTLAANNNIGQSAGNVTLTNAPLQPASVKVIFCARN